jgi:hypothetical protein
MDASRTFRHRNYDLVCSAKVVDNGRFAPGLVVCRQVWPTRPRTIDVPRGDHYSAEAAIDAAFARGVEWVEHYG